MIFGLLLAETYSHTTSKRSFQIMVGQTIGCVSISFGKIKIKKFIEWKFIEQINGWHIRERDLEAHDYDNDDGYCILHKWITMDLR